MIDSILDQNLFREIAETTQSQIATSDDQDYILSVENVDKDINRSPQQIGGHFSASTQDSENLSPTQQKYPAANATVERFEQLSISKGASDGNDTSHFSLFAPISDDSADYPKTQMAPKLDAQTLFAFGTDTFSSAFSASKKTTGKEF